MYSLSMANLMRHLADWKLTAFWINKRYTKRIIYEEEFAPVN